MANRVINGMSDGVSGAVDKPIDLVFDDSADVLDVHVKNVSGDVVSIKSYKLLNNADIIEKKTDLTEYIINMFKNRL